MIFRYAFPSKVVNNLCRQPFDVGGLQKRHLWGWLNSVFNRVDQSRIKEVGPDRACAEWLLRCGAGVKWDRGDEWTRDYNSLPVGNYRLKILEIDATDSAVMQIGFPHLKGLKHVRKVVLHKCGYLEDEAVSQLGYIKDTLKDLQISSCGNVSDEGILSLKQLVNLENLFLYDFLEVKDRKHCLNELTKALPQCKIKFPFARESDRDKDD